ncbi:MAG: alpha/beta hydrolase family protein [Gemmatimonadales bacterium]
MPAIRSLLTVVISLATVTGSSAQSAVERRVVVQEQGWELIGDLSLPAEPGKRPAVLMLNAANRDRTEYAALARELARRGVASLRLDLRGHGESVNRGRFVPGEVPRSPLIWDSEADVLAALRFLREQPTIDGSRIGVVGASYSGEEMAEAGRIGGFARAYVALSPGSFSDESVDGIDRSGAAWLFVASRDERFMREITAAVRERSRTVELLVLPGVEHGTRLLGSVPGLPERLAVWLATALR